ncbi:MaoC/PaaZ C-terminal domain-containing protein [Nocardioides daejeonensis]|uniref:MaoC/PaaZ C-terminal domain-containing protein n=1 Tax=Nocardioides daejeonensis TaxID=1046556 RepID=UPI00195080D4|nr:MaoC/PaaZ C-terminal domain-containing protein [Nocardioides daejeonensis]
MSEQVCFEDVAIGDVLPTLEVVVDETQMFLFSAATYNAHRIHYDKDWARDKEGYDNVLVQGPLQAALLARAVTDWVGASGRLVTFSVQNRATALPGETLLFGGTVTAVRGQGDGTGLVDLEIAGRRGETVLMPGTAIVSLPARAVIGAGA